MARMMVSHPRARLGQAIRSNRYFFGFGFKSGMGLIETIIGLAACVVLLIFAILLDRRPYRPGQLNYIPLMIIALAACLVLSRHLLTLIR
jgi:hypothetical protein